MWRMLFAYVLLVSFRSVYAHVQSQVQCGGELVNSRGIIQTPGFPREFPVPLRCHWIINASHYNPDNVTIIVYLTQLYVTTGLTFTEYADVSFDMGSRLIHSVTEKNATVTSWVLTPMQYLKIDFVLDRLEGNHLRVLDDLIDVYGFNITYEIRGKDEPERADACTATACSFAGNCLANQDYTQYGCSCFKGFSGRNCGQGPLCQSDRALCQNGGVCRVLGSGGHVCICPDGVTGLRCEHALPDPQEVECGEGGCVSQCPFVLARDSVCNCPKGPRVPTESRQSADADADAERRASGRYPPRRPTPDASDRYTTNLSDRARYEGTVRLANLTALRDSISSSGQPSWSLENTLHKQIGRFLRSFNLSRMEELRVLNITPGAEVTFHFFGGKKDGGKVRDALNRLVERGRIGNLSLVTTHLAFKQEPTLLLQRVVVNQDEPVVREDDEFILSCVAQGSSYMTFQWYKDGMYINETKAMRSMWSELEPMNSQDQYTAILGISHASKLDEGVYTCQVVDWGMQQCKSIRLEVWTRPSVAVSPMSITLERGGNVHIKCMSSKDGRHEKLGYNWTKNKALFKMAPGKEVWEDLSPSGSILKIYNAQKSAVYTCLVHGRLATKSVDVQVEVVNSSVIALCPDDLSMGIHWPETAPSLRATEKCPPGYIGHAKRSCSLRDTHLAVWHLADFSSCVSNALQDIVNNFVRLTLGYQNTSGPETLAECLRYLSTPRRLYPGEGESTVMLMKQVQTYMNHSRNKEEFANATRTFYQIVNILLEHDASLLHQERVVELQELVKSEAAIWGSMLSSPNSDHLDYSGLVLDVALLESSLNYKLHFPLRLISYPIWYMEDIFIYIDGSRDAQFGNKTFNIAVMNYKNLSRLLPMRYMTKLNDGIEVEYEINSRIVSIELSRDTNRIYPLRGSFAVEIEFEQIVKNYSSNIWNTTCGFTDDASFAPTWDFESCYARTKEDSPNVTICKCNKPGTYAMLLVARNNPIIAGENHQYHMVVIIGCACCLVQTILTLLLLFPYWWHHRSCLIFLKMQCCTATSGAMGIFIYAVRDTVPKTSLPYVTTSLEAFLLIGMSSHLSKLLIVYTEVVQIPRTRHLKQTVICLITIVPVIAVLFNHLAHDSTGWQLSSWWLMCGTMLFYIFISAALVMLVMFAFLYYSVMRKLKLLSGKHADGNKAIVRRVGLLRRAGAIYCVMVFMVASSILYVNVPEPFAHYIFSFASALLGFTIFLLYILRSETPLHYQVLKKLKLDNTPETEVSSESTDSPLRFFTKQDGETESESAPPPRSDSGSGRYREKRGSPIGHSSLSSPGEGLLLVEAANRRYMQHSGQERAPSTVETYIQSGEGSVNEYNGSILYQDRAIFENVTSDSARPENCQISPNSYQKMKYRDPQMYSEYVEQEIGPPKDLLKTGDQWQFVRGYYQNGGPSGSNALAVMKPEPSVCYIKDSSPVSRASQDGTTTRVCVELGVMASRPLCECKIDGSGDEAPSIVMCNVDVEPFHRNVLEMTDSNAAVDGSTRSSSSGVSSSEPQDETIVNGNMIENLAQPRCEEVPMNAMNDMQESSAAENVFDDPERKQIGGQGKPPDLLVTADDEKQDTEGMLDRISHDLDYLLNRRPQPPKIDNTLVAPGFSRKTSKPPSSSVRCQIQEEDEDEGMGLSESFNSNSPV